MQPRRTDKEAAILSLLETIERKARRVVVEAIELSDVCPCKSCVALIALQRALEALDRAVAL